MLFTNRLFPWYFSPILASRELERDFSLFTLCHATCGRGRKGVFLSSFRQQVPRLRERVSSCRRRRVDPVRSVFNFISG